MAALAHRIAALEAAEQARTDAIHDRVVARLTDAEIELLAGYYDRYHSTLGGAQPTQEEEVALWNYYETRADVYLETYKRPCPRPGDFEQRAEAI